MKVSKDKRLYTLVSSNSHFHIRVPIPCTGYKKSVSAD